MPWVVDYRDPWMYGHGKPRRHGVAAAFEAFKERIVLRAADAIIVNTPRAQEALAKDMPAHAAKMNAIPNGFDPENFAAPESVSELPATLSIVHAGELYAGRDPRPYSMPWSVCNCRREPGHCK